MKKLLVVLLGITMCIVISGCNTQNGKIKSVTKKFEKACNKIDVNEMLDCMDPSISKGVRAVADLVEVFTSDDTEAILEKVATVLFNELPENSKEFFSSIKIFIDEIEIDEDVANAAAVISYKISGEEYKTDVKMDYICVDGKWYISSLGL